MAYSFQTIKEFDLGGGIDNQSAENQIPQSFCEDLENVDPLPMGQLKTRVGYQGFSGWIPFRAIRAEYTTDLTNNLCFFLDSSIDLSNVRTSPIVVQGKTSNDNSLNEGDFPNDGNDVHWYADYTIVAKKTFNTGFNTLTIPQAEHGKTSPYLWIRVAESTSSINNSNEQFEVDSISIDKTTYDVTITYTNGGTAFDGFVAILDRFPVSGSIYVGNTTTSLATQTIATGTNTYTVLAGTHNLNTFNLLTEVYLDDGTNYVRIEPEEVSINASGDVSFEFVNGTGSPFNALFQIQAAPIDQVITGSVPANTTQSITISNIETDFLNVAPYLETFVGGPLDLVGANSIEVDSATQTATIEFVNGTSSAANFELYYTFESISTNKLCVTAYNSVSAGFTDSVPQLTIWGLSHSESYGSNKEAREGWTNHVDSYRSTSEDRLIAGLGGNLFASRLREEDTNAVDYLIPTYYPDFRARVSGSTFIGPAFYDSTDTPSRTRGFIKADTAGANQLEVTSATWQSGSGYVRYRLDAPSLIISGTLSTILSSTTGLEDELTVTQMGYGRLNGTFKIKAVTSGVNYLDIDVDNPSVTDGDFDESNAGGRGGVFTDRLTLTAASPFLTGDVLNSELFEDLEVSESSGSTLVLNSIEEQTTIPDGLRMVATRNTSLIPIRELDGTETVENLVRGDMIRYSPISRLLKVKYVRSYADTAISIDGDGSEAIVTLGSGNTLSLTIGQKILIRGSTSYNGEKVVTSIESTTEFTFESEETTTEAGSLIGNLIEVDEVLDVADSINHENTLSVDRRWIPIEVPTTEQELPAKTYVNHFDANSYSDQEILRSTMVQNNLYFVNGTDEVMKFDGSNVYRAGLFRWQPHLFATKDTTASGVIVLDNPVAAFTASTLNRFTVAIANQLVFPIGTKLEDSRDGEKYVVIDTDVDATNAYLIVNRNIETTVGGGNLTQISTFKYYFRLNAIDANDNLVASATVGSDDFVMEMGTDSAINLRLLGMPAWHIYDYERLEVEIYRTKADQVAPFYRLTTLQMLFNEYDGYINFVDTNSDGDLIDLDAVVTSLAGAELGNTWSEPIRAKYCTSADNRLILGNLTDWPTIDLQVVQNNSGPITISDFVASGNNRYLFRRDNTDTNTTTSMNERVAYQFVDSTGAVTITPATDITAPAANTINIADVAHGLAVGDWIYLYHSAVQDANDLEFAGWFQVTAVPDADNFRFRYQDARAGTVNDVDRYVTATAQEDVPVFLGTDGNYAMLNGNRDSVSDPYEFLAMRRMANAINASMRKVDSGTGEPVFTPWLIASAGNEFNAGQLIVRRPKVESTSLELQLPALTGSFDVFVNGVRRSASTSAGSLEKLFPSRLIQSFPNFPEIFDAPTSTLDIDSQSAADVNSADGQELTALIPFFGDSAFGGATKSGIVVPFKENSIYLFDPTAKAAEQPPIQKIESEGKGCTAPFSVSTTKTGIIFANFSGIYRLGRDLSIDYVGRKVERIWREELDRNQIDLITGHHFAVGNQYKLSVPIGTDQTENNEVLVYNHTREYEGKGNGSWTTYTNHAATGWANLLDDSYFATTSGEVFSVRRAGDVSDYRDDSSAISVNILIRSTDFGDSGRRKMLNSVISHFRTLVQTDNLEIRSGMDLIEELDQADSLTIKRASNVDNLTDIRNFKLVSIESSFAKKIGVYVQLQYVIEALDEPIELAGIDYRVAVKDDDSGIQQAVTTQQTTYR